MANIREQKFRKLKKFRTTGSVFAFIIVTTLIIVGLAGMTSTFFFYVLDSKVGNEYSKLEYMAELYEFSGYGENEDILKLLNKEENSYIIVDENDKVLKEHGKNTCDLEGSGKITVRTDIENDPEFIAEMQQLDKELKDARSNEDFEEYHARVEEAVSELAIETQIYRDKESGLVYADSEGDIEIDYKGVSLLLNEQGSGLIKMLSTEGKNIELPFWMPVDLNDGTRLIGKAYITINLKDAGTFLAMGIFLAIMILVVIIVIFSNMIKNHKNRKKMNEIFFMDEVTGKKNWMWFIANSERVLKKRSSSYNKYAVLDIVFVNYRNFCVCHSVEDGEKMLCRVNEVIEKHLEKKEMVAHYASANFVAMLKYVDRDRLEERVKNMVSDLEKIDSDHKFTFHVGIYRIGECLDERGKAVKRKDLNIDNAYNNACTARSTLADNDDSAIALFDEEMVKEKKWIDWVAERQQKAVDNEEFLVYYQPKYNPSTRKLSGAEALIRWRLPETGEMIPPGKFIPIFEKSGFITQIDHYMLSHVAADQKKWIDEGFECVPVSVNVSRAHFIESDLAEQIRDIVDNAGSPRELIEIELTESAFFDDKHAMIRTIKQLKEYGFKVSMDDFGAGYSSLNSLKEMPLDVLKLDADFFRNDEGDGRGQIVVSEAIRLAKNLNMLTVAEGVEQKEQVEFLANQGCDMIQGYYYARPMPKDDYKERIVLGFAPDQNAQN